MCSNWEGNQRPFGLQPALNPLSHTTSQDGSSFFYGCGHLAAPLSLPSNLCFGFSFKRSRGFLLCFQHHLHEKEVISFLNFQSVTDTDICKITKMNHPLGCCSNIKFLWTVLNIQFLFLPCWTGSSPQADSIPGLSGLHLLRKGTLTARVVDSLEEAGSADIPSISYPKQWWTRYHTGGWYATC